MRQLAGVCAVLAVLAGTVTAVPAGAAASRQHRPALPYDFNGDGYVDAAIGAPGEDTGAVHVVYGGAHGLTSHEFVLRGDGHGFGSTVASADVNRDGYADLAVGRPDEGGGVWVFYGSADGVTAPRDQITDFSWDDGPTGSSSAPDHCCSRYGSALAFGDFNDDGFADLAVGGPQAHVQGSVTAVSNGKAIGVVLVYYGSTTGLHHNEAFAPGVIEEWDARNTGHASSDDQGDFGGSLTALPRATGGDDLVIGWPNRDAGGVIGAGAIEILTGDTQGLDGADAELISLDSPGVAGQPQAREQRDEDCGYLPLSEEFGAAVATGDFNGDGVEDLAVGIPEREVAPPTKDIEGTTMYGAHGAVSILYGSTAKGVGDSRLITLKQRGVPGRAAREWYFGLALAVADVNGDGIDDLAIGAPATGGTYPTPHSDGGGIVLVAPGSARGIRPAHATLLREGRHGVPGHDRAGDFFGADLTFWTSGHRSGPDLMVGAPGRRATTGAVVDVPDINGQLEPGRARSLVGSARRDMFAHLDGTEFIDNLMYTGEPREDQDNC